MKLKRLPEDFRVEELPTVRGADRGRYTFYRLKKRGVGTIEAIDSIARHWNLAARQISYGGLKDRHAETIQYLTIADGPARAIEEPNLLLEPLGKLEFAYGPAHFRGNRFGVVLRDLSGEDAASAIRAMGELPVDGLPNYFDDQRFGSVGYDGDFIGRAWLAGDHEKALKLAIAEANPSDRPDTKVEKAILRENWRDWAAAKAKLDRSHARSLVTYLVDHPEDFRGAFARLKRELRSLYFSAYQSHLWNLALGRLITRVTEPDQRAEIEFKAATMPIHRGLTAEQAATLRSTQIPLPSSRNTIPDGLLGEILNEVATEQAIPWSEMRVKHLKDVFFSKGHRAALIDTGGLSHNDEADELYPGRRKLSLEFELPKGGYATIVVKRLTEAAR
ncbi:tRNA pseudouridine(13) synthase TruD [Isosphaeraceae bacterium EP7]